jgi:uncharacterized protein YbjT (DUF2867 family)
LIPPEANQSTRGYFARQLPHNREKIMKIAVTTPTGHVGSAVADFLLELGGDVQVRLLGRRPDKLADFVKRGAETVIGAQDDADYLCRATKNVDALLWVTPPGYGSDDLRGYQNRLGEVVARAIQRNDIPRVVNLSSVGANLASGTGPIAGLHDVEQRINKVATHVTHLRPGFFFENVLWQLDSIRNWGRISLPLSGSTRYPMIATRDIGRVAATRLTNATWNGQVVQELHGPTDLSYREVAEILAQVLGRKIVYIKCDREELRENLLKNAISESAADSLLELYAAAESGKLQPTQPRSPETTTSTTFAEFAREVIVPLISAPVGSGHGT